MINHFSNYHIDTLDWHTQGLNSSEGLELLGSLVMILLESRRPDLLPKKKYQS